MNEKAFTLIETLLTAFILAFLLLGLYIIFEKGYFAWNKGNNLMEQHRKIRGCLDLMSRELKSTFISSSNNSIIFKGDEKKVLFFSSSNIAQEKGEYDIKRVEYKMENCDLIRKIKSSWKKKESSSLTTVLADNITGLKFSYYNGKRWQNSWDSQGKKTQEENSFLPCAVKILIVVKAEAEPPLSLSTVIYIPVG